MRFNYTRSLGPKGEVLRPIIPITLRNPKASGSPAIGYLGLVDSGSDRCVFPAQIAELLGIDLTATERVMTVGGVVAGERRPVYIHTIEIEVGLSNGPVCYAQAAFMPDFSASGQGLLGRRGFFDQFTFVKFKEFDGLLEIGRLRPV